jgi:hypothetical protein
MCNDGAERSSKSATYFMKVPISRQQTVKQAGLCTSLPKKGARPQCICFSTEESPSTPRTMTSRRHFISLPKKDTRPRYICCSTAKPPSRPKTNGTRRHCTSLPYTGTIPRSSCSGVGEQPKTRLRWPDKGLTTMRQFVIWLVILSCRDHH